MSYYFITALSDVGPVNFPVFVDYHNYQTIGEVVASEARRRLVVLSHWEAKPITEMEYLDFVHSI